MREDFAGPGAGRGRGGAGGVPAWLAAVVFCSGAACLAYELLWVRVLSLGLGSSAQAVCVVLSVFMGGLALGAAVIGPMADSCRAPLRLYAALEAALGAYCLATPHLFRLAEGPWAVPLLLPPTILMGGTMPALAREVVLRGAGLGTGFASLYFWNTAGGVAGALAVVYRLIPSLGVSGATSAAAMVSLAAGAAAWACSFERRGAGGGEPSAGAAPAEEVPERPGPPLAMWAIFGLSGLGALAYETVWTRLLALVLGSTVYSFALMLAAFLLGIALGGLVMSRLGRRLPDSPWVMGLLQAGIAAACLAGLFAYRFLPPAYLALAAWCGPREGLFHAVQFGLVLAAMLPATLLMGVAFPWFARVCSPRRGEGRGVGAAYAVNTLGAMAGPWAASLWLVPGLGLSGAAGALGLLHGGLAAWAFSLERAPARRRAGAAVAAAAAVLWFIVPPVPANVLYSGVSANLERLLRRKGQASAWRRYGHEPLFVRDGVHASVSVWRYGPGGMMSLVINGKTDASDGVSDMPTQLLAGHIPMLLSPGPDARPRKVLVIGLGSGVTVAAAASHGAAGVDVVEIERAVAEAAWLFSGVNRGVLREPRVRVAFEDGRGFLRRSTGLYDVIISEPSNPWIAGVSHLFTGEHYRLARGRLAPGGVFCQWLQLYRLGPEALAAGLEAFRASFPRVLAWKVNNDLLLLGSEDELAVDWTALERRLRRPGVAGSLAPYGLSGPPALLARWMMDEAGLARLAASAGAPRPHTDDRPVLEFLAPAGLRDTGAAGRNSELLEGFSQPIPASWGVPLEAAWPMMSAFASAGRPGRSRGLLAAAGPGEPRRPGYLAGLGELFVRRRLYGSAAAVFQELVAVRPRDLAARLDLAGARLEGGDLAGALEAVKGFVAAAGQAAPAAARRRAELAAKSPSRAALYLAIGEGYAFLRERGKAERAFKRARELSAP